MKTFSFALVFDRVSQEDERLAGLGCTAHMQAGQLWLSFMRDGETLNEVIGAAQEQCRAAGLPEAAFVSLVDPEHLRGRR